MPKLHVLKIHKLLDNYDISLYLRRPPTEEKSCMSD